MVLVLVLVQFPLELPVPLPVLPVPLPVLPVPLPVLPVPFSEPVLPAPLPPCEETLYPPPESFPSTPFWLLEHPAAAAMPTQALQDNNTGAIVRTQFQDRSRWRRSIAGVEKWP